MNITSRAIVAASRGSAYELGFIFGKSCSKASFRCFSFTVSPLTYSLGSSAILPRLTAKLVSSSSAQRCFISHYTGSTKALKLSPNSTSKPLVVVTSPTLFPQKPCVQNSRCIHTSNLAPQTQKKRGGSPASSNRFRDPMIAAAATERARRARLHNTAYYLIGCGVLAAGVTYASVPLYRVFCQKTGFGGTTKIVAEIDKIETLTPLTNMTLRVEFDTSLQTGMAWTFEPQQDDIMVHPGETALAFFTAHNPTERPIVGVSTYNVLPFEAGAYFNKIQCFCFEEQLLNPGEEVDMPVFFYIDPEIANDPGLYGVKSIILSYTFYESKAGLVLPQPLTPPGQPRPGAGHDRSVPDEILREIRAGKAQPA